MVENNFENLYEILWSPYGVTLFDINKMQTVEVINDEPLFEG